MVATVTRLPQDPGQLELPIGDLVYPEHPEHATHQERFEAFDQANRWIYFALVMLVEDWLTQGNQRASIDMLVHILRWQYGRTTRDGDRRFKINNNHTSRYARKLMDEHPEWGAVFYTRDLKTP